MPPAPLTRRNAIRLGGMALVTTLTGCVGAQTTAPTPSPSPTTTRSRPSTDEGTPTSTPTPEPPTDILRRITVASQDDIPADANVTLTAATLAQAVTTDHTARLRITFTNTATHNREFTFGASPPFSEFWSVTPEGEPSLLLLAPDTEFEKTAPDCWRPATDAQIRLALKARYITLEPGEQISRDVDVWDSNQNSTDECLVSGRYRFEEEYGLPDDESLEWGFTLRVIQP